MGGGNSGETSRASDGWRERWTAAFTEPGGTASRYGNRIRHGGNRRFERAAFLVADRGDVGQRIIRTLIPQIA